MKLIIFCACLTLVLAKAVPLKEDQHADELEDQAVPNADDANDPWFVDQVDWSKVRSVAKQVGKNALKAALAKDEEGKLLARDELKNEVHPQVPRKEELENDPWIASALAWKVGANLAKHYGTQLLKNLASDEERKLLTRDELKNEVQSQELKNDPWFVDSMKNVDWKKMGQLAKEYGPKAVKLLAGDELKNEDLPQELKNDPFLTDTWKKFKAFAKKTWKKIKSDEELKNEQVPASKKE